MIDGTALQVLFRRASAACRSAVDRLQHCPAIESSPTCADVLIGTEEIARSRPCIIAFGKEAFAVAERDSIAGQRVARAVGDLDHPARDLVIPKRVRVVVTHPT